MAEKQGKGYLMEVYDSIKETMLKEKDRAPNLDFPVAVLYKVLGLPIEVNTPVFQASRHFGWVANMKRQREAKGRQGEDRHYRGWELQSRILHSLFR